MTFNEVIEGLYSENGRLICSILNNGEHVCKSKIKNLLVIHTGFYCQVQTGTVFEVLYGVKDKKIYYQKQKTSLALPMGLPILINLSELPFQSKAYGRNEWYNQYNVTYGSFHVVLVKEIKNKNSRVLSLILSDKNNTNVSHFSICDKNGIIKTYPLCIQNMPVFYLSHNGFYFYKQSYCSENDLSWNNYGKSYEKYNGYNGWSDDLIDDVFGGVPEATWNVD